MGSCSSKRSLQHTGTPAAADTTPSERKATQNGNPSPKRSAKHFPKVHSKHSDPIGLLSDSPDEILAERNTQRRPKSTNLPQDVLTPSGQSLNSLHTLTDHDRKRLSVSTVSVDGRSEDKALLEQARSFRRTLIKKYTDPALVLLDEKKGAIRQVTLEMIRSLFSQEGSRTGIFGAPACDTQKGFENKYLDVLGTYIEGALKERGVGYCCKKGLKPESPNQDDFFILRVDDWAMYGVFDGHGPCGHDVSHFVHNAIAFLILSDSQFEIDPKGTMRRSFRKVHHLLEASSDQNDRGMDCSLSGTTCTIVVHKENRLYIAHVGDSRAVMAQKGPKGHYSAVNLTTDHKPTRADELARIEKMGGEVRRLQGDIPHRVFVKGRMYPGLAMSRAIGDTVGASVGVIADPDVVVVDLSPSDAFLIISTDGVWEFISSQEAVDMVASFPADHVQEASEKLASESWKRWVAEEENVVDDITSIVVWI